MILNVYKEKNWTSFDVVAKLRGILKTKKIGHGGTLDPLAEGVLVVLTDKDTKKQSEIMSGKKTYICDIAFGLFSKTYDLEGPVEIKEATIDINKLKKQMEEILPKYIGDIKQRVPSFSAVKVKGKRLFELARKSELDKNLLPIKEVHVESIQVKGWKDFEYNGLRFPCVTLEVECGKGFYVRSLASDLGDELGFGGVLTSLTRVRVGDFDLDTSKKISEINNALA